MRNLPWPEGWHRPRGGGWPTIVLFVVLGTLCVLIGPIVAVSDPAERAMGIGVGAFGVVCFAGIPTYWPRRDARPYLDPVAGGLVLPYSAARMVASMVGCFAFAVAGAGLLLTEGDAFRRVVGAACVLFFGAGGVLLLVRRGARYARVVLTPAGVAYGCHGRQAFLAWEHVAGVHARETVVHTRGGRQRTPYVAIEAADPSQVVVDEGRAARVLRRAQRTVGGDISIATPQLGVDPRLVYWTLAFYLANPAFRAELADQRGVERARAGAFGA